MDLDLRWIFGYFHDYERYYYVCFTWNVLTVYYVHVFY